MQTLFCKNQTGNHHKYFFKNSSLYIMLPATDQNYTKKNHKKKMIQPTITLPESGVVPYRRKLLFGQLFAAVCDLS